MSDRHFCLLSLSQGGHTNIADEKQQQDSFRLHEVLTFTRMPLTVKTSITMIGLGVDSSTQDIPNPGVTAFDRQVQQ
jgi:hypothetical protein